MGWISILTIFFTNSSDHPDCNRKDKRQAGSQSVRLESAKNELFVEIFFVEIFFDKIFFGEKLTIWRNIFWCWAKYLTSKNHPMHDLSAVIEKLPKIVKIH
jgi:hypothetical protein